MGILYWPLRIRGVTSGETALPFQYASGERDRGIACSLPTFRVDATWSAAKIGRDAPATLLTWNRFEFELPARKPDVWVPWQLHLEAQGNGFIYLNAIA